MHLHIADQLTQRAITQAVELEIKVSVAVVDAAGHLVALRRMDGASWLTVDIAQSMAYTAAGFGMPGDEMVAWAERPWFRGLMIRSGGRVLPADGGRPAFIGGQLAGAIGVSGGSNAQDRACAEAALAAL